MGHEDLWFCDIPARYSEILHELEISLPAHPGRAKKILDDEHGHLVIDRNHDRSNHPGLNINEVVAALSVEGETLLLERFNEL
jgi:hypothetical protein